MTNDVKEKLIEAYLYLQLATEAMMLVEATPETQDALKQAGQAVRDAMTALPVEEHGNRVAWTL